MRRLPQTDSLSGADDLHNARTLNPGLCSTTYMHRHTVMCTVSTLDALSQHATPSSGGNADALPASSLYMAQVMTEAREKRSTAVSRDELITELCAVQYIESLLA
jgi:hypothetical protein